MTGFGPESETWEYALIGAVTGLASTYVLRLVLHIMQPVHLGISLLGGAVSYALALIIWTPRARIHRVTSLAPTKPRWGWQSDRPTGVGGGAEQVRQPSTRSLDGLDQAIRRQTRQAANATTGRTTGASESGPRLAGIVSPVRWRRRSSEADE